MSSVPEIKKLENLRKQYNIKPKKSLDQHFLISEKYILKEIDSAGITKRDVVLEIGAGIGTLTEYLLDRAGSVIAFEIDRQLEKLLRKRFLRRNFRLIEGDVLKQEIPDFDVCVSNIPYSVSSKILLMLGKMAKPAVLMLQKEFAQRVVARPGDFGYSRISVVAGYYFLPEIICVVPKTAYFPVPEVDSAIVRLVPRERRLFEKNEEFFLKVVLALFMHKNQTTKNALIHSRNLFGLDKELAQKTFRHVPHSEEKPRTLSIEAIAEISAWILKTTKQTDNSG